MPVSFLKGVLTPGLAPFSWATARPGAMSRDATAGDSIPLATFSEPDALSGLFQGVGGEGWEQLTGRGWLPVGASVVALMSGSSVLSPLGWQLLHCAACLPASPASSPCRGHGSLGTQPPARTIVPQADGLF